jgi:hypothetical protein
MAAEDPGEGRVDIDPYKRKNYRLAIITAFLLFVYTSVAAYQAVLMRRTASAAQASAIAAQTAAKVASLTYRPIVKISQGPTTNDNMVHTKMLSVDIYAINYGPLDATDVRFFRYQYVSAKGSAAKQNYEDYPTISIIAPKAEGLGTGEMIIPGTRELSPKEYTGLIKGDLWATFSILITYNDGSGKLHHAEYCTMFTLRPDSDVCPWPARND